MTATIENLIIGVNPKEVSAINWGHPRATIEAFNAVFQDTKCECLTPSEAELENLQAIFEFMAEDYAGLPWEVLLHTAFGIGEEKLFKKDDPDTSYFWETPKEMVQFDFGQMLIEIRKLYTQIAEV